MWQRYDFFMETFVLITKKWYFCTTESNISYLLLMSDSTERGLS